MKNINQKTVNFEELFTAIHSFIKISYCDDEVKYCDFMPICELEILPN